MINNYTGKPYSFRNYNCWHHAAKVRKDNNIKTSSFSTRNMADAFKVIKAEMLHLGGGLTKVSAPRDMDIVFVSRKHGDSEVFHCGVYYHGHVSHCCREHGSVRVELMQDFIKNYEAVTIWR